MQIKLKLFMHYSPKLLDLIRKLKTLIEKTNNKIT